VQVVLPRVRDIRSTFDGRGNYTMGLRAQLVFPEIDYTRVDKIKGHEHHADNDGKRTTRRPRITEAFWRALRPQA